VPVPSYLLSCQYGNKYMKNKKTNSMPKQDIKERSKKAKKDKVRENPSSHPGDATALPPVPGVDSLPAHHARGGC
jgi:hypothetical protein